MWGSASDRTRAISWGEMVIAESFRHSGARAADMNVSLRLLASPRPARKRLAPLTALPCARVVELRHGGAQLGDAGAAARRGHEHLRVRRRVPGEHRLGRGKKCRAL